MRRDFDKTSRNLQNYIVKGIARIILLVLVVFTVLFGIFFFKIRNNMANDIVDKVDQGKKTEKVSDFVDTNEELIDEVDDTAPFPAQMYLRMADDYLAGREVASASSIPRPDPLITKDPIGSNVEMSSVDWDYDPQEDLYAMPVMKVEGMQKRPIVIVSFEYDSEPFYAEVYIDTVGERVASWRVDQR